MGLGERCEENVWRWQHQEHHIDMVTSTGWWSNQRTTGTRLRGGFTQWHRRCSLEQHSVEFCLSVKFVSACDDLFLSEWTHNVSMCSVRMRGVCRFYRGQDTPAGGMFALIHHTCSPTSWQGYVRCEEELHKLWYGQLGLEMYVMPLFFFCFFFQYNLLSVK